MPEQCSNCRFGLQLSTDVSCRRTPHTRLKEKTDWCGEWRPAKTKEPPEDVRCITSTETENGVTVRKVSRVQRIKGGGKNPSGIISVDKPKGAKKI